MLTATGYVIIGELLFRLLVALFNRLLNDDYPYEPDTIINSPNTKRKTVKFIDASEASRRDTDKLHVFGDLYDQFIYMYFNRPAFYRSKKTN